MSFHRHRATFRSITFNEQYLDDGTANPDDPANIVSAKLHDSYQLEDLQINRVSTQDYRELRQYLEGAEANEAFEGIRSITGLGRMQAASYAALEDKAWAFNEAFSVAACRRAAVNLDPPGVLPFDGFRDTLPLVGGVSTKKALRFYCRPGPGRPSWVGRREGGLVRPFAFQLIAFDPFAYDVAETQTLLGSLVGGGNTVTNPGTVYARPRIRIAFSAAGAAAVVLANSTTGKSFSLNLTSGLSSEVWILDAARSKLYRESDGANRYSTRISGFLSDMVLEPGDNTITWSSGTGIASVRFDFRGAYP